MLNHVDLFSGTGAFSIALSSTNRVKTIYANDIEPNSKKIFDANHGSLASPLTLTLKDLHDIETSSIPSMDILTGGFPCQPFSIAGLRQGFDDKRSNVFWKILEILKYHQPSTFILENVKNLVSHESGNTFRTIKKALEGEGYFIKYEVLNTSKVTGIPHNRERIYIVGFKDKKKCDLFIFPSSDVPLQPISDFLEEGEIDAKYYYSDRFVCYDLVKKEVTKHVNTNTVYQLRRQYIRENKSSVCPTLTANMGAGGHNVPLILDDKGVRKLTPRECFNLQGFGSDYILPVKLSDSALYKLAGNAITVAVAKRIAEVIIGL